jgi:hypothetical protein
MNGIAHLPSELVETATTKARNRVWTGPLPESSAGLTAAPLSGLCRSCFAKVVGELPDIIWKACGDYSGLIDWFAQTRRHPAGVKWMERVTALPLPNQR